MNDVKFLENRFTAYMTRVVQFARKDYMKKLPWKDREVSFDAADIELSYEDDLSLADTDSFAFSSQEIEDAFCTLSDLRKKVLELAFVQEKTSSEIAHILGCPVKYVYTEKNRALHKLRKLIERLTENER